MNFLRSNIMELIKTKNIETIIETYQVYNDIHLNKTIEKKNGKVKIDYELYYKDNDINGLNFRPLYVDRKEFDKFRKNNTYYEIMENKKLFKKITENTKVEKENIILLSWNSNTFWDADENPLSHLYVIDYIGSLQEHEHFKGNEFDSLIGKIKKHPYVKEITIKEIEYYNSDFNGQRGINLAHVFIPDEEYIKLWNKFKNDQYPSCRVKDIIQFNYVKGIDLYGLNKDLKKFWENRWGE